MESYYQQVLCDKLLSLSLMCSRFTMLEQVSAFHSCLWLNTIPRYGSTTLSLFIHWTMEFGLFSLFDYHK